MLGITVAPRYYSDSDISLCKSWLISLLRKLKLAAKRAKALGSGECKEIVWPVLPIWLVRKSCLTLKTLSSRWTWGTRRPSRRQSRCRDSPCWSSLFRLKRSKYCWPGDKRNFQIKIEMSRLELQLLHPNAAFKTGFKTNYWLGRRPLLVWQKSRVEVFYKLCPMANIISSSLLLRRFIQLEFKVSCLHLTEQRFCVFHWQRNCSNKTIQKSVKIFLHELQ